MNFLHPEEGVPPERPPTAVLAQQVARGSLPRRRCLAPPPRNVMACEEVGEAHLDLPHHRKPTPASAHFLPETGFSRSLPSTRRSSNAICTVIQAAVRSCWRGQLLPVPHQVVTAFHGVAL